MHRLLARLSCAVALVACSALVSCAKTEDKVRLEADGSGTFSQTTVVDLTVLKQLLEWGRSFGGGGMPDEPPGDGAGSDPLADFDLPFGGVDDLKERAKGIEGVKLTKALQESKDAKITVSLEGSFADLESFAKLGVLDFGFSAVELAKNADGTWTLTLDPAAQIPPRPGGARGTPGDPPSAMPGIDMSQILMVAQPMLGEFEVKRTLALPGAVTATNGVKSEDGKSVTWTLKFADLLGATVPGSKGLAQTVTFKGEGVALKPFKHTPPKLDFGKVVDRLLHPKKRAEPKAPGEGETPKGPDGK